MATIGIEWNIGGRFIETSYDIDDSDIDNAHCTAEHYGLDSEKYFWGVYVKCNSHDEYSLACNVLSSYKNSYYNSNDNYSGYKGNKGNNSEYNWGGFIGIAIFMMLAVLNGIQTAWIDFGNWIDALPVSEAVKILLGFAPIVIPIVVICIIKKKRHQRSELDSNRDYKQPYSNKSKIEHSPRYYRVRAFVLKKIAVVVIIVVFVGIACWSLIKF